MQAVAESVSMLALFKLGGGEIILIVLLLLILLSVKVLPPLNRGLRQGLRGFRDATDELAEEAGRSLGGIYGKPAAEALTPDNKVAELYKPAAFDNDLEPRPRIPKAHSGGV